VASGPTGLGDAVTGSVEVKSVDVESALAFVVPAALSAAGDALPADAGGAPIVSWATCWRPAGSAPAYAATAVPPPRVTVPAAKAATALPDNSVLRSIEPTLHPGP
jgi:hypothetical protein